MIYLAPAESNELQIPNDIQNISTNLSQTLSDPASNSLPMESNMFNNIIRGEMAEIQGFINMVQNPNEALIQTAPFQEIVQNSPSTNSQQLQQTLVTGIKNGIQGLSQDISNPVTTSHLNNMQQAQAGSDRNRLLGYAGIVINTLGASASNAFTEVGSNFNETFGSQNCGDLKFTNINTGEAIQFQSSSESSLRLSFGLALNSGVNRPALLPRETMVAGIHFPNSDEAIGVWTAHANGDHFEVAAGLNNGEPFPSVWPPQAMVTVNQEGLKEVTIHKHTISGSSKFKIGSLVYPLALSKEKNATPEAFFNAYRDLRRSILGSDIGILAVEWAPSYPTYCIGTLTGQLAGAPRSRAGIVFLVK
jgi:hypothetical protein